MGKNGTPKNGTKKSKAAKKPVNGTAKSKGKKPRSTPADSSAKEPTTVRQQSIPGTSISELEVAAEKYYAKVAERLAIQKEEATALAALNAVIDKYQAEGKLVSVKPDTGKTPIYRYEGTDPAGNQKTRVISESFVRNRSVNNDKKSKKAKGA